MKLLGKWSRPHLCGGVGHPKWSPLYILPTLEVSAVDWDAMGARIAFGWLYFHLWLDIPHKIKFLWNWKNKR